MNSGRQTFRMQISGGTVHFICFVIAIVGVVTIAFVGSILVNVFVGGLSLPDLLPVDLPVVMIL